MSKFIILAIARSGSTSLARVLGKSKDVKLAIEPFHPDYSKWYPDEPDYSKQVTDEASLDKIADELFNRFTAFKTLNYQLDTELYEHLMLRPHLKVILLYRKNILESALSAEIGKQTNAWHKNELNKEAKKAYDNLKPIDIDFVRKNIEYSTSQHAEFIDFLKKNKAGDYLEIYYEGLYSEDFEKNLKTITKICKFLNVAVPDKKYIDEYMKVSNSKINYKEQLKMIPNYNEIMKEFGT